MEEGAGRREKAHRPRRRIKGRLQNLLIFQFYRRFCCTILVK